jgi:hypothetical protein
VSHVDVDVGVDVGVAAWALQKIQKRFAEREPSVDDDS